MKNKKEKILGWILWFVSCLPVILFFGVSLKWFAPLMYIKQYNRYIEDMSDLQAANLSAVITLLALLITIFCAYWVGKDSDTTAKKILKQLERDKQLKKQQAVQQHD